MIHHTVTNGVRHTRALYRQLVASHFSFSHSSVYNYLRLRDFYVFLSVKTGRIKKGALGINWHFKEVANWVSCIGGILMVFIKVEILVDWILTRRWNRWSETDGKNDMGSSGSGPWRVQSYLKSWSASVQFFLADVICTSLRVLKTIDGIMWLGAVW